MNTPKPIDRTDPLWRQFFFEAWRQQLARLPTGDEGLFKGPALAKHSAGLADDAIREALGLAVVASCKACGGVGCTTCAFTGREPSNEQRAAERSLPSPCRACGGSGKASSMGDDGIVVLSETESCPHCQGSGQYTGSLIPAEPAPTQPTA